MNNVKLTAFILSVSMLFESASTLTKEPFLLVEPYKYEVEFTDEKDLKKIKKN